MSWSTRLQSYVDGILWLQEKYGWMMDSYVLDFFTDNLWNRLPRKWSDVLAPLRPEEIGYFFLEMYSTLKCRKVKEKPKFRKIWPLELLAFLASSHALRLDHQTWTKKTNEVQNTTLENIAHEESTKSSHMKSFGVKSTSHRSRTTRNDSELKSDSEPINMQVATDVTRRDQQFLQREAQNLSHPFRRHIKPKKLYEIDVLSKVVCEHTERLRCWNIVDVGAGLGHLSRLLSFGCRLRVVTIEGESCHQSGAEKIDAKVLTHLNKEEGMADRFLIHITHHINSDISVKDFSNVVLEAFTKMRNNTDASQAIPNPPENFIIVGLHTCGDLAPTLLRVFSQCENAVGIISIGCCYMKLSYERARTDQLTTNQKRNLSTRNNRGGFKMPSGQRQSNVECREPNGSRNNFANTSFEQKKDEKADSNESQTSTECVADELKMFGDTSPAEDEKVLGYPMSGYVKSLSNHRLTYNALESSCHAIERYHRKLIEMSSTLKLHYHRALLELLLKQKSPDCPRRQIRSLRTKKAAKMNFFEYVTSACDILGIEEDRPTSQDINVAEELHAGKEFNVVVFYVLRLLMAPVVEGLLLVDRLMFIKEKNPDIDARISMLFDPDRSPRNYAIIADKLQ